MMMMIMILMVMMMMIMTMMMMMVVMVKGVAFSILRLLPVNCPTQASHHCDDGGDEVHRVHEQVVDEHEHAYEHEHEK